MKNKIFTVLPLFLIFPLILLLPHPSFAEDGAIKLFISREVESCLTSGGNPKNCDPNTSVDQLVLNTTHNLRNDWVKYNLDRCSTIPIRGNYVEDNKVEYIFPSGEKLFSTTRLMDLSSANISDMNSLGTSASTQGYLNTTPISTMQDYSPKPISWLDLPYWTENSGSSTVGSRNAILFEFFDSNMNPASINSFGAWFGDLETRTDSIPAYANVYDNQQNSLTENFIIPQNDDTELTQCGNTSGHGKGCGNHTTRWIGFSDLSSRRIQKFLVTVGEDDFGADGSREHLSYTGPTIMMSSTCTTPTVKVIPSPTTFHTSIPTIFPSITLEPTPTNTIIPTQTKMPSPAPTWTPLPTAMITSTVMPTDTILPTNTPTPSLLSPTTTPSPIPVNSKLKFCNNYYEWNKKIQFSIIQKIAQLLVNKICSR
jgi:hypothetical protein